MCVEVAEAEITGTLESAIAAALRNCTPILFYVVIPSYSTNIAPLLRKAKELGVGIIQFDDANNPVELNRSCSQSFLALQNIEVDEFPKALRHLVSEAVMKYKSGDARDAIKNVYDQIEAMCRSLAEKMESKSFYLDPANVTHHPGNLSKCPWARLMTYLDRNFDNGKAKCKDVDEGLLNRIAGLTDHRNDVGHQVRNLNARKRIDAKLRTRFEHALEVLLEFGNAAKSLKIF